MTTKVKAIKYCIYPTVEQMHLINCTFGCCRFAYNKGLDASKEAYQNGKSLCTRNDFNYNLTELKNKFPFLKEVDSTALTAVSDNLASSFVGFFAKRTGYPCYHKKTFASSYTTKRTGGSNNIAIVDKGIKLPKIGVVKASLHRLPKRNQVIKAATVSRTADGKFYVSIRLKSEEPDVVYEVDPDNAIGLDYASDGLYVDNNGNSPDLKKRYRVSEKQIARRQKKLSRMKGAHKGETPSNNYKKQRLKVAKAHQHVKNQRLDDLHKLSTEIANQYDIVCVETLNMRAMSNKSFGNGKATLDNGYGLFLTLLGYKLADRGKCLIKVDKWYPSSQLCSCCGYKNVQTKNLGVRKWTCPSCGATHDRDVNAATNILNEGIRIFATLA